MALCQRCKQYYWPTSHEELDQGCPYCGYWQRREPDDRDDERKEDDERWPYDEDDEREEEDE